MGGEFSMLMMIVLKGEPDANPQQLAATVQDALQSLATDDDKSPDTDSHLQVAPTLAPAPQLSSSCSLAISCGIDKNTAECFP